MKLTLSSCITARRIGHWSYGTESEYDANGELAPITWICNCGSMFTTEVLNRETDEYYEVPQHEKQQFLAEHQTCMAKCYKCHTNPVEKQGYWCEECDK